MYRVPQAIESMPISWLPVIIVTVVVLLGVIIPNKKE